MTTPTFTTPAVPTTADLHAAVDAWFDAVGAVLGEQRKLAATLVDAGVAATGTWTEQARTVASTIPFRPAAA